MLVQQYDEKAFSNDVVARWGHLSVGLTDDAGLLHLQMGDLAALCLSCPDICNEVLGFLSEVLARTDAISEIENAVAISFIEWPQLIALAEVHTVPSNVGEIVRRQWERHGAGSG